MKFVQCRSNGSGSQVAETVAAVNHLLISVSTLQVKGWCVTADVFDTGSCVCTREGGSKEAAGEREIHLRGDVGRRGVAMLTRRCYGH